MGARFPDSTQWMITYPDVSCKGNVLSSDDKQLVTTYNDATRHLSTYRAAEETGISEATVRRLRNIERPPARITSDVRVAIMSYLERVAEERAADNAAERVGRDQSGSVTVTHDLDLPDVSFLKPRARDFYDRAVGGWVTRGWLARAVSWGAHSLINQLRGASTLRRSGPGDADLTEDQQLIVLEGAAKWVEEEHGKH